MIDLAKILNFTRLLNKFRQVLRVIHVNGEDRWENDVEHSYQLVMLAWYIIDSNKLDLNIDMVMKYALIHDLVEVYAGDTYIFSQDMEKRNSKERREQEAAEQIKAEFAEFEMLNELIEQYEKKADRESRFVYALDKIEPMLSIYTNNGRTWKEKNITMQMLFEYKEKKVAVCPEIKACFDDLMDLLKKEEHLLFKK